MKSDIQITVVAWSRLTLLCKICYSNDALLQFENSVRGQNCQSGCKELFGKCIVYLP